MITYLIYQAGSFLARVLPFKIPEGIAWTIGQASCLLRRRERRNVEDNLGVVFPGVFSAAELRKKSRRVIMNFARAVHVFLKLPTYRWETLGKNVDTRTLEEAINGLGDRPVFVLASIHMGPWELGGLCLSGLGYKMHTVALEHASARVTRFFEQRRADAGLIVHPMRKSYPALEAAIERGESVALLIDRAYGATSKRFDFFGVEPRFPLGHLMLSVRTGVPVITTALLFSQDGGYEFVVGGVHKPATEGLQEAEIMDELQRRCLSDFEKIIREHHDQWFLFEPLENPDGDNYGD